MSGYRCFYASTTTTVGCQGHVVGYLDQFTNVTFLCQAHAYLYPRTTP